MSVSHDFRIPEVSDDLEEYLRITGGLETRQDNPQLMRIRQHFERKNKKYSQELAQLQVRAYHLRTNIVFVEKTRRYGTTVGQFRKRGLFKYI